MSAEAPRSLVVVQVDAFSSRPFGGNPAALCVLDDYPADAWLQAVAREMNLSETAFLRRRDDGWDLRWFTPAGEVDLCGHATLASAHVLLEDGLDAGPAIRFFTLSGELGARRDGDWLYMDFPAEPPVAGEPPDGLLEALGLDPTEVTYTGRNRLDELVAIEDPARLRTLEPAMTALAVIGMRGVVVTSPSDTDGVDFLSRYFAPAFDVPEDPVTGSTHCCLAPFWTQRLGRDRLVGYQASRRGGTVRVYASGDRVELGGQAVTVMRGTLTP
ncbi:MAG: PhzF family phenazine biosynthesis protein [Gemmatimonadota bacterium]